jgi:septal ring-binding cell division protein DamX
MNWDVYVCERMMNGQRWYALYRGLLTIGLYRTKAEAQRAMSEEMSKPN